MLQLEQVAAGRCLWAGDCGQVLVGRCLRAGACGQVLVGRCLWAGACGQVLAGRCLRAGACGQVLVGRCLRTGGCQPTHNQNICVHLVGGGTVERHQIWHMFDCQAHMKTSQNQNICFYCLRIFRSTAIVLKISSSTRHCCMTTTAPC